MGEKQTAISANVRSGYSTTIGAVPFVALVYRTVPYAVGDTWLVMLRLIEPKMRNVREPTAKK